MAVVEFLTGRVFPILRSDSGKHVRDSISALIDAGMASVEVTITTPGALDAISWARENFAGIWIGAGTVCDPVGVKRAAESGAQFCVSPIIDVAMISACSDAGVWSVPGAATPTEMVVATRAGASAVKVFPARPDGPEFLRQIFGPLPDLILVPTGAIELDEVPAYLDAGAAAVGLTRSLLGDALTSGDMASLSARAQKVLEMTRHYAVN